MSIDPTPAPETLPPFGANVDGVRALIPEAPILAVLPPGGKGVTVDMVTGWLTEFTRRLSLALDGWERLRSTPTIEEAAAGIAAPRDDFAALVRNLIHNAVASYTEAARFPERAETGYASVLWARFTTGLDSLSAWLVAELNSGDVEAPGAEGPAGTGAYSFPPPTFTSRLRF
jgi:hypothetical protein